MANKSLFRNAVKGKTAPPADMVNQAGGEAYKFTPKHALAQYAATGTLNGTYYASEEDQLKKVLELVQNVPPEFIAKTAVYARESGRMKDMPALLLACLAGPQGDKGMFRKAFPRVVDNGKMLRNFAQIIRSGAVGRKSFGHGPKKLIQQWIGSQDGDQLFRASVGNDPSLSDIIKMVHPKPADRSRRALYAYLTGKDSFKEGNEEFPVLEYLTEDMRAFERYKKARGGMIIPKVPMEMLVGLDFMGQKEWSELALIMSWTQTRMNLNTMLRHDVFKNPSAVQLVADRLRNPELIKKAKPFPYQLLTAFKNVNQTVPGEICLALQDAMELSVENVPAVSGNVFIMVDVSGSMQSPVTGHRKGSTSKTSCLDVAALIGAVFMRKNPRAVVIPFEDRVVDHLRINSRDSIMTNAEKLSTIGGGGTNCSAPLKMLNQKGISGDLIVYASDNQSWVDSPHHQPFMWGTGPAPGTTMMQEWNAFKVRNPKAKLVCIDLQPYDSTQVQERQDVLNIGGFSDNVFDVISLFAKGELHADHWVGIIEGIKL